MKVIFSSRAGSTKRLAEAIGCALECEVHAAADVLASKVDLAGFGGLVVFGFWCDKGQIDDTAAALLPALAGKEVAAFFTAGSPASSEVVASMKERFAAQLRALNAAVVAPIFMAQGEIAAEVIERAKRDAAARGEEIPAEKLARWEACKGRPNEEDFAAAHEWALRLLPAGRFLASARVHMNTSHQAACELLADFYGLPAAGGATGGAETGDAALKERGARGDGATGGAETKDALGCARVLAVDFAGLALERGGVSLRAEFLQPAARADELEDRIKQLCALARQTTERKTLGPSEQAALSAEVAEFRRDFKSAMIASLRPNGAPLASYAPIIEHGGALYAFISEVAEHFEALQTMKRASVMFAQSEATAPSVFARKRLRYEVFAQIISRDEDALCEELFAALAARAGAMSEMFKRMKDFHFVRLKILSGRYVKGFGAAYCISHDGKFSPATAANPHKVD